MARRDSSWDGFFDLVLLPIVVASAIGTSLAKIFPKAKGINS
jgi:hypothetical protein